MPEARQSSTVETKDSASAGDASSSGKSNSPGEKRKWASQLASSGCKPALVRTWQTSTTRPSESRGSTSCEEFIKSLAQGDASQIYRAHVHIEPVSLGW